MQTKRKAEPSEVLAIQQSLAAELPLLIGSAVDADMRPQSDGVRFASLDAEGLMVLVQEGGPLCSSLRHRRYISCMGCLEKTEGHPLVGFAGKVQELSESDAEARVEALPAAAAPRRGAKGSGLVGFLLFDGEGMVRTSTEELAFAVGAPAPQVNYYVTNSCTGCAVCVASCPQLSIDMTKSPVVINQVTCIRCGTCYSTCPYHAIVKL